MAIYSNDRDPNEVQWEKEQHQHNYNTIPSYREWWEINKEHILAEDELNRAMNMKHKVKDREDEFLNNNE